MSDKLIETLAPSQKQRLLYFLILIPSLGIWFLPLNTYNLPLPTVELEAWFLDKLIITLSLLSLLFAWSVHLLRHEKDAEIVELKDKIKSHEDSIKIVANTIITKNKQIESLNTQLNYNNAVKESHAKLQEKLNEPIKIKYK